MTKPKSPTEAPKTTPLAEQTAAWNPTGGSAPTSAEVINTLSNAPPYLLSRAEAMYIAHSATLYGEAPLPFSNRTPLQRAAWLSAAQATES